VFVQGCDRHCDGCHNPGTWDPKLGITIDIDQLASELREKSQNKKITISGGEPLLQFPAILELVKKLEDFDIALYTGFEYAEVPTEIIPYLRYIKVGKYIKENRTTITEYIGSTNQQFIDLRGK
jgi:anaerobic ribonucleoside-triphosphate reductase activating protein